MVFRASVERSSPCEPHISSGPSSTWTIRDLRKLEDIDELRVALAMFASSLEPNRGAL